MDVDFMTLNNPKLKIFIFPEFIINSRAILQRFVEIHQFHVILLFFKQMLNKHVLNKSTYTLLDPSSKYMYFSWNNFCQHKLLGFVDQCVLQVYIILNHFHSNMCMVMELCTRLCLCPWTFISKIWTFE